MLSESVDRTRSFYDTLVCAEFDYNQFPANSLRQQESVRDPRIFLGFFWSGNETNPIMINKFPFSIQYDIVSTKREKKTFFLDFQIHTNPCPVMNNPLLIGQGCPTV
jgi:hypothetical protein